MGSQVPSEARTNRNVVQDSFTKRRYLEFPSNAKERKERMESMVLQEENSRAVEETGPTFAREDQGRIPSKSHALLSEATSSHSRSIEAEVEESEAESSREMRDMNVEMKESVVPFSPSSRSIPARKFQMGDFSRDTAPLPNAGRSRLLLWGVISVLMCFLSLLAMAGTHHLPVERKLLLAVGIPVAWMVLGSITSGSSDRPHEHEIVSGTLLIAASFSWFVVGFVVCLVIREGARIPDDPQQCVDFQDLSMLTS